MTSDPGRERFWRFVATPQELPERIGRYRVGRVLGQGGVATVYESEDPDFGRRIALKVLSSWSPKTVKRFEQEAAITMQFAHPNLVKVYEVGTAEGFYFIAMEFVDGRTLDKAFLDADIRWNERIRWIADAAKAVAYAHERGVIHRDLKPGNILLDGTGRVFLTDFGLARLQDSARRLTSTGTILGTPCYMAPEQAKGEVDRLDARTDVYALGALFYEALAGKPPFFAESLPEILSLIVNSPPPPFPRSDPSIPLGLESLCLRALSKDPSDRHADAGELLRGLGQFGIL